MEMKSKMKMVQKCIKPNLQRTKFSGWVGGCGGRQDGLKNILVLEFIGISSLSD